jgi:hypothetical protein
MFSSAQSGIIKLVVDFINENFSKETGVEIPNITFDELSVDEDSICLSSVKDNPNTEKLADCTGKYYSGVLPLSIIYRVMQSVDGIDDLNYIDIIDTLVFYLRNNKDRLETDNFYVESISQLQGGKLDTVYDGNVKDFRGMFQINYERW